MTANVFYCIKDFYYIVNKTLFAFSVTVEDDSALCVCTCDGCVIVEF